MLEMSLVATLISSQPLTPPPPGLVASSPPLTPPPSGLGSFTQYTLSLQWPKTYCLKNPSKCWNTHQDALPNDFSIHGLWPDVSPSSVQSSEAFDFGQLEPIEYMLMQYFLDTAHYPPSNYRSPPASWKRFWEHEWNEHGTYTDLTQYNYFGVTLQLFFQAHCAFQIFMFKYKLGTNISTTLLQSDFAAHNMEPKLVCYKDGNHEYLFELPFILDKTTYGGTFRQYRGYQPCGAMVLLPK